MVRIQLFSCILSRRFSCSVTILSSSSHRTFSLARRRSSSSFFRNLSQKLLTGRSRRLLKLVGKLRLPLSFESLFPFTSSKLSFMHFSIRGRQPRRRGKGSSRMWLRLSRSPIRDFLIYAALRKILARERFLRTSTPLYDAPLEAGGGFLSDVSYEFYRSKRFFFSAQLSHTIADRPSFRLCDNFDGQHLGWFAKFRSLFLFYCYLL